MSLKSKWERAPYRNNSAYTWLFIKGRMLIVNDPSDHKSIRNSQEDTRKRYSGTKIVKELTRVKSRYHGI